MSEGVPWLPLSFGSQESNFPSSCLNFMEHMKNTHRQKITSTIGTTLIATGLSDASLLPAMVVPPGSPRRGEPGLAFLLFRRLGGRDLDLVDAGRAAQLDHLLDVPVRRSAVLSDQDLERGEDPV